MSECNLSMADVNLQARLQGAGLRVTRPRLALCRLLFDRGPRHLTAKHLYSEARASDLAVSLPTVQRTLRSLCDLGMIRRLATGGAEHVFDTDPSEHHHMLLEQDGTLIDVRHSIGVSDLPVLPPGSRVQAGRRSHPLGERRSRVGGSSPIEDKATWREKTAMRWAMARRATSPEASNQVARVHALLGDIRVVPPPASL
jgi:Fur family iron response transcriptional regulator